MTARYRRLVSRLVRRSLGGAGIRRKHKPKR